MKEVTDDFVDCFGKPENRSGFMWQLIKMGAPLPVGVDADDPRVLRILSSSIGETEFVSV